ncbi:MAG: response regulator transcription factor [Rhizobiaceae bacterium]|nr:response regulator transcription factor [Rhizobiaceae bacterium]
MPKTILIADDHPFTIEGMNRLISDHPGYEVVSTVNNGIDAIAEIKSLQPDCAIIDLSMPGANGLEVFMECRKWAPETKIAVLTGMPSAAMFEKLIRSGVHGLFLKNASPSEITAGIHEILQGRKVVSADIQKLLELSRQATELTNRESEVLQGVARGLSNNRIAEQLGVSPKTVDSHRTSLMRKLEVHSTATLLVQAMKEGLIDV